MATNNKIPKSINQWRVKYAQNDFLKDENWLKDSYLTEDLLQLSHNDTTGPVLDVGFYRDRFKIHIIYNFDWENPKEVFESADHAIVSNKVYEYIDKYANG